MSIVAEFAGKLEESLPVTTQREFRGIEYPSNAEKLYDIRAVIFDVYGTLIDYRKPEFDNPSTKERSLLSAFDKVVEFFSLAPYLQKMNPHDPPQKTLSDFYHGLIALDHEKSRLKKIEYPEILVERIWETIILMVKRHGYDPAGMNLGDEKDLAKCMAFYYHFKAFNRRLFPGVVDAIAALRQNNFKTGILSNAQFYTEIDLDLFIRKQSDNAYDSFKEIFEPDLVFFSFEYQQAKPGRYLFVKLFDALYELHILPAQTVFVGNDLVTDIAPAQEIGLKTALFCGDSASTYLHDSAGTVVPDISFQTFAELSQKLSFFEDRKDSQ